jgi:lipopolysaccharide export system permease protein
MLQTRANRYILREILSPTLLCLLIFTMVMVLGRAFKLVELIVNKGVALTDIMVLLVTLMPTFFSVTLPLAFLMGIMIGLGRMSADSETVALKSAGIGLAQISIPVFTLAVIFVILTGITNIWVKPWGYRAFETRSFEIARQKATVGFQPRIFMNQFKNLVLYANDIDDRAGQMQGLFIVEKKPESTSLVFADSGRILVNEESESLTLRLEDGVIHRQQTESFDNYQLVHFRNYDIQPETSLTQTKATRKEMKPKAIATGELIDSIEREESTDRKQELRAELHLRMVSPMAPLLFVLFGLPFSITAHRSGRSSGFVMGLVIFLAYYFLLSSAFTFTKDAAVSPWLTFWTLHILLAASGAYFLRRSCQERQTIIVYWLDQTLRSIQKRARKNVDA